MAHSGVGTALGRASWPPSRNTAPREHRLVSPLIPVRPRSAATPATWLSRSWTPVWPCACRPKEAKTRLSGRPARARSGWLRCWEIPPWLTSKETPRGGLAAERGGGPCLVGIREERHRGRFHSTVSAFRFEGGGETRPGERDYVGRGGGLLERHRRVHHSARRQGHGAAADGAAGPGVRGAAAALPRDLLSHHARGSDT